MEYRVWKYELEPGVNEIELPYEAVPLSVGWQGRNVMMWVLVEHPGGRAKDKRKFLWIGTGHKFERHASPEFVGTVQDPSGFVWHVFEV